MALRMKTRRPYWLHNMYDHGGHVTSRNISVAIINCSSLTESTQLSWTVKNNYKDNHDDYEYHDNELG